MNTTLLIVSLVGLVLAILLAVKLTRFREQWDVTVRGEFPRKTYGIVTGLGAILCGASMYGVACEVATLFR